METKTKKRIYINPPPPDYRCEICGRPFSELKAFPDTFKNDPIFRGHTVINKEHTEIRLFKTYRGSIQISASWECFECMNSSDINDVADYFITDYPDDDYPVVDSEKMENFLDILKDMSSKTTEEYFQVPAPIQVAAPENIEDIFIFSTRYWKRYFDMYGDNYKQKKNESNG